jgi:hypothetical protein
MPTKKWVHVNTTTATALADKVVLVTGGGTSRSLQQKQERP